MHSLPAHVTVLAAEIGKVCPKPPPGAQKPVDDITGYVLWGVIILFGLGVVIGIGAVVGGRIFSMPHASKLGVISIVVVFVAAVGYLILPGMVNAILGQGCLKSSSSASVTVGGTGPVAPV